MTLTDQISQMIDDNNILLFMKGNPHQPRCGFSGRVVEILKQYKIEFSYLDILEDPQVRAELPTISDWPTFPQLFVRGELVGGCDIVTEMHNTGELQEVFEPKLEAKVFKETDEHGVDEDGVVHDKCGTDDCCQKCDTSDEAQEDGTV